MDADAAAGRIEPELDVDSVHRIEFEVPWPPKHVAAYLIEPESPDGETILIDAGSPGEESTETLREGLADCGWSIEEVDHVLLTHPHTDHTGQVPALREAGATIHAPRQMLEQLERDEDALEASARSAARGAGYEGGQVDAAAEQVVDSLRRNRRLVDPEACLAVDRDEPFAVGGREFVPHHTPGHQVHHTCFETTVGDQRLLFAGDALIEPFRPGIIHVGLDHGAYEGADAFYTALDRLDEVDVERALPGHGPSFTDLDAVAASTREDLDELVDETEAAVADVEPATPVAVTEARAGQIRYPVQLLDTMAALGTLDRQGVVDYELRDGVRYYERS